MFILYLIPPSRPMILASLFGKLTEAMEEAPGTKHLIVFLELVL